MVGRSLVAAAFGLFAFVLPSATVTAQPLAGAKVPFSIDPRYEAAVENF